MWFAACNIVSKLGFPFQNHEENFLFIGRKLVNEWKAYFLAVRHIIAFGKFSINVATFG